MLLILLSLRQDLLINDVDWGIEDVSGWLQGSLSKWGAALVKKSVLTPNSHRSYLQSVSRAEAEHSSWHVGPNSHRMRFTSTVSCVAAPPVHTRRLQSKICFMVWQLNWTAFEPMCHVDISQWIKHTGKTKCYARSQFFFVFFFLFFLVLCSFVCPVILCLPIRYSDTTCHCDVHSLTRDWMQIAAVWQAAGTSTHPPLPNSRMSFVHYIFCLFKVPER